MSFAFSEQNWGVATRQLTDRVKKRTVAQIALIINDARETPLTLISKREAAATSTVTEFDQYCDICASYCSPVHSLIIITHFSRIPMLLSGSLCVVAFVLCHIHHRVFS